MYQDSLRYWKKIIADCDDYTDFAELPLVGILTDQNNLKPELMVLTHLKGVVALSYSSLIRPLEPKKVLFP